MHTRKKQNQRILEKREIVEEEEIDFLAKEKESAKLDVAEFRAMIANDEPIGVTK
ncbi:hypothetical protein L7F22_014612, partial [Adiantum nelumboides]|nr:hypothetical protein [Adiantum nelumboides]